MKYKTSELSKILNVSANTIRRFAEKGYLLPQRDEKNKYRYFESSDVEKTIYIGKYRKIGFSHDEIADIFSSNIKDNNKRCQDKLMEMDKEIERLTAIRHMLKDDINMMKRIDEYGTEFIEMDCVPFYFVSYQIEGELCGTGRRRGLLKQFLYECPEIKYIYIFRKENILKRKLAYEEAIAIKKVHVERFNVDITNKEVEPYIKYPSIMRIVRVPIDFMDDKSYVREEIKSLLYDEFFNYMKEHNYELAGDAIAIKIGYSKEDDGEMQYILLSMPVDKKQSG